MDQLERALLAVARFEPIDDEDMSLVNDHARDVIAKMRDEHGEAWIGKVNFYDKDRIHLQAGLIRPIRKWDGDFVYNFDGDFVLPKYDEDLARMIVIRDGRKLYVASEDAVFVTAIFDRVSELGGRVLMWV